MSLLPCAATHCSCAGQPCTNCLDTGSAKLQHSELKDLVNR